MTVGVRREAPDRDLSPAGLRMAAAALVVGLLYAAVSIYWGLGGTWLLNTIGGALEKQGRAGHAASCSRYGLPWP